MRRNDHPGHEFVDRPFSFNALRNAIGNCTFCPDICSRNAQPRKGRIPVLFVGESPSKIGVLKNDIFRGTAVELMSRWKDVVYETNAIACLSYPAQERHRKACEPWLLATILSIPAKAVFTFGKTAHLAVTALGLDESIPIHKFDHPCYLLRFYKKGGVLQREFKRNIQRAVKRYS